jgi:exosortase J
MSTLPTTEVFVADRGVAGPSPVQLAAASCVLAVLGLSSIAPTVYALWDMWTTNALKSIGMAVPFVSFFLILRVWRRLEWRMDGTWWGLAVLTVTVVAVYVRQQAVVLLVATPEWTLGFPPHPLIVFVYGSGVVLLFGGTRLYRAALFPILFLFLVNPVPHIFNMWIDLPLQHASAHIARAFAIALGQPLTSDKLRLMFTPEFGMFIAPGCNGIRGAVTMGMIALVAGYVYRFRWYMTGLAVLGAVLLGYVFNLLRLCFLVLYYLVALHFHSLQDKAENADYVIGAVLFMVAAFLLVTAIQNLRGPASEQAAESEEVQAPEPVKPGDEPGGGRSGRTMLYARMGGMAAIVLVGLGGMARGSALSHPQSVTIADPQAVGRFPAHLGQYTMTRTWNEALTTGQVVYAWASYAPADGGTPIAVGVSPTLGAHDVLICHSARGDDPMWQSELTVPTAGDLAITFSSAFFNDGSTQYLEASTVCNGSHCGEHATARKNFGFIYSSPDAHAILGDATQRPIPVLLRAESLDMSVPADTARQQLTATMRGFLANANLDELTRPYRN